MARILLVEDSPTQASEVQLVVESHPSGAFEVDIARDGRAALELLHQRSYDLVLSDVIMPLMTGYELCAAIRAEQASGAPRIPVLLFTTLSQPVDILRGLRCGADAFVSKPCEPGELMRRIEQALAPPPHNVAHRADGTLELTLDDASVEFADIEPERLVELLVATFEEYVRARRRERDAQLRERLRLSRARRLLQLTLDALHERVAILDAQGLIVAVNAAWSASRPQRPVFGPWFKPGDDYVATCQQAAAAGFPEAAQLATAIQAALHDAPATEPLEYALEVDGETAWFCVRITHFVSDEGERRVVVSHEDVSAVRRATVALAESEARYARAVAGVNDGLWDWDLDTDRIHTSPRFAALLGEPSLGSSPAEWLERIHPEDREALETTLHGHLAGHSEHFECEHRVRLASGEERWLLARGKAVRDEHARPRYLAGSLSDVTARHAAEDRLRHAAFHDSLTGLHNRAWFEDRLRRVLERVRHGGDTRHAADPAAVLYVDLDRFKLINDSLGHATGDALLVEVARRLEAGVRPADHVARLGGDEFVVLLERLERGDEVTRVAQRLGEAIARPIAVGGHELVITASIGVAPCSTHHRGADEVLQAADLAMYRAKTRGPGRVESFVSAMRVRAVETLARHTELRRAVADSAFELRVEAMRRADGAREVVALDVRPWWPHPRAGLLAPAQFVRTASELGLHTAIDRWTLASAIERHAALGSPPLRLVVRIAGATLAASSLCDWLLERCVEHGLEPAMLQLALAEHDLAEGDTAMARQLSQLRALGIGIVLDELGVGRSALARLYRLPLDALRLDASWLDDLDQGGASSGAVASIARLARDLGLQLIASDVARSAQLEALAALGCSQWHGPLGGGPRPLDARDPAAARTSLHAAPAS